MENKSLFDVFLEKLPKSPEELERRNVIEQVWTDGEQILCGTGDRAEFLADLLKSADGEEYAIHWYDPEVDEKTGDTDEYTGWWYVYLC